VSRNTTQNDMLPVALTQAGLELEVDLEKEEIRKANGKPPIGRDTGDAKYLLDKPRRHRE
jgi:hypothetical protein